MKTAHTPSNFEPSHYEVLDYFDNKPPEYHFGMEVECFKAMMEQFRVEKERLFPDGNCFKCQHCGNGNVRYVICAIHIPTGKHVCFGDVCVAQLGFKNHDEFKAAKVRAKAALAHKRILIYRKYVKYCETHPQAANLIADASQPIHAKNGFVQDVVGKLKNFGELSDKQLAAVIQSMARDIEYQARKAANLEEMKKIVVGDAPSGRQTIEGVILSTRNDESDWGLTTKMLVKLDNGAKVWCTAPSNLFSEGVQDIKGARIELTATFTVSKDDKSFAFGKRPYGKILTPAEGVKA